MSDSHMYYLDPERVAEIEERRQMKYKQGCRVCVWRDMQIMCFDLRACTKGKSPLKGKKFCHLFKLEDY